MSQSVTVRLPLCQVPLCFVVFLLEAAGSVSDCIGSPVRHRRLPRSCSGDSWAVTCVVWRRARAAWSGASATTRLPGCTRERPAAVSCQVRVRSRRLGGQSRHPHRPPGQCGQVCRDIPDSM